MTKPLSLRTAKLFLLAFLALVVFVLAAASVRARSEPASVFPAAPAVDRDPTPQASSQSVTAPHSASALNLAADLFCPPASAAVQVPTLEPALTSCARHLLAIVNGERGPQPAWKLDLCRFALASNMTRQVLCKRTTYCPSCDPSGVCADGTPLGVGKVAADRTLPLGTYLWLEGSGVVKVCDRGGKVTLSYTRLPERHNVDLFVPSCSAGPGTTRNLPMAVLSYPVYAEGRNGKPYRVHSTHPGPVVNCSCH